MSDPRIGSRRYFEKGIDRIVFKGLDAVGLPEQRELTPAEEARQPMLDRLLALRNLEDFLEDSIRPDFSDRDLLLPVVFRQALEHAMASFVRAAERRATSDRRAARTLKRAAELLEDEVSLRELLAMYRSALLQG